MDWPTSCSSNEKVQVSCFPACAPRRFQTRMEKGTSDESPPFPFTRPIPKVRSTLETNVRDRGETLAASVVREFLRFARPLALPRKLKPPRLSFNVTRASKVISGEDNKRLCVAARVGKRREAFQRERSGKRLGAPPGKYTFWKQLLSRKVSCFLTLSRRFAAHDHD